MAEYTTININEDHDRDIEHGPMYSTITHVEDNELSWGFIRKVYATLTLQMVLTTAGSFLAVLYAPTNDLPYSGLLYFIVFMSVILICLCLWEWQAYQLKHSLNLVLLGLFATSIGLIVGLSCGKIMLEALILTSAVVSSLSVYTFWAPKKGKDFSYHGCILLAGIIILLGTTLIQVFFPLGPATNAIFSGFGALLFSWYIIYDTENLIGRFRYDEHIWASVTVYSDMLNLFPSIIPVMEVILDEIMTIFEIHWKNITRRFVLWIVHIE